MSTTADSLASIAQSLQSVVESLQRIEENTKPESKAGSILFKRRSDGRKVNIYVRISVICVGEIDTVKQEFFVDFWMSATWREPGLKGQKEQELDWSDQWDPRIVFFNAVTIDDMVIKHYLDESDSEDGPFVRKTYRIRGTFKENMELYHFPLDYQALTIQLMSDWPCDIVEFHKDLKRRDTIRKDTFTGKQEWVLQKYVNSTSLHTNKEEGGSPNIYPLYYMSCFVKRKYGFYISNILLIMLLIEVLSFTSFAVPTDETADRLSVNLTLLLTAVAFKFAVSQTLPVISYLTLLDKYILVSLLFLFAVSCENGVAGALHTYGNASAKDFDEIAIYIAFVIFVVCNTVKILLFVIVAREANKELALQTKNFEMRGQEVDRFVQQLAKLKEEKENKRHEEEDVAEESRERGKVELPGTTVL